MKPMRMLRRIPALTLALLLAMTAFMFAGCASQSSAEALTTLLPDGMYPHWAMGYASVPIPLPDDGKPHYIAGYHNGWEIEGVYDNLSATAVWIDAGADGVLLIGVDCVGLSGGTVEDVRTALSVFCAESGCASVNVFATHTHAGIDTLGLWGPVGEDGKNEAFMASLKDACVEAATLAYAAKVPGKLYFGSAETAGLLADSRDPQVYDPNLYQIRFAPDDGVSSGIRLLSYPSHAETLGGKNTKVSRDYPGILRDVILERTGDGVLFMPSTVGGLIKPAELRGDCGMTGADEQMLLFGIALADYALSIAPEDESVLEPDLAFAHTNLSIPLDNTLFFYYRFLGVLDQTTVRDRRGSTGYALQTELSVLRLDNVTLALLPCELFPELLLGGTLPEECAANPGAENPTPLGEIAAAHGHETLLVLGLANGEIGYVIPPNDYLTDPGLPYFTEAEDRFGESHYEETNSAGIGTASCIADALDAVLSVMTAPK